MVRVPFHKKCPNYFPCFRQYVSYSPIVFSRFGKLTTIFLLKIFAWVDKMGGTRFWRGMQQKIGLLSIRQLVLRPCQAFYCLGATFWEILPQIIQNPSTAFLVVSESILQFVGFWICSNWLGGGFPLFQTPIPGMRRIWRPMWYLDWQERVVWHPETSCLLLEPTRFRVISKKTL